MTRERTRHDTQERTGLDENAADEPETVCCQALHRNNGMTAGQKAVWK